MPTILVTHDNEVGGTFNATTEGYSSSGGSAPTYDTTSPIHGARSLLFNGTANGFGFVSDVVTTVVGTSMYFYFTALPTGPMAIQEIRTASAAIASFQVTNTGDFRVKDGGGTTRATFTAAVAAGTWYRVDAIFPANSTQQVNLYVGDSTTAQNSSGSVIATAGACCFSSSAIRSSIRIIPSLREYSV